MMFTHQLLLLLLLSLNTSCQPLLARQQPLQTVRLHLSAPFAQEIPTRFHNFQYSALDKFQRADGQNGVCAVKVHTQGSLVQHSSLSYLKNQTKQWMKDEVITSFQELKSLSSVQDTIYFGSKVFAFLSRKEVIVYSLDLNNGTLTQSYSFTIEQPAEILDGRFLVVEDRLLIVSSLFAYQVQPDATVHLVQGYNGTGSLIRDCKVVSNSVYLGLGEKGLMHYQYISGNNTLILVKRSLFRFKSAGEEAAFGVDELQIDLGGNSLLVLDYVEGLLQIPLTNLKQSNQIFSSTARLLLSHCQNLIVLSEYLFVSCPELVQLNRTTGQVVRMLHNTFYPYQMRYLDQRLYLYGRHTFAVYDLFGKVLDQYALLAYSESSLAIGQYLLTFSRLGVVSQEIRPQVQQLYCYADRTEQLGSYEGTLQTEGICKEYTGQGDVGKGEEICYVNYPIKVEVRDPFELDLTIELYILLGWLGFSFVFGVTMAIKHLIVRAKYRPLTEEDHQQLQSSCTANVSGHAQSKQEEESVEEPA